MTLLEQCQIWHENDEYQKIIDAIEAVPAGERTPELDSELARAYNNAAEPGDRALFEKAIGLLKPHEDYFAGDHNWNFRMGYAYYYLDEEGPALHYFEQALAARPGDRDTQELIEDCRSRLALPRFAKPFRVRTEEVWTAFQQEEGELRRLLDQKDRQAVGEELLERCGRILYPALSDVAFELGFNGEKYELILTPEGDKARLFELVYFRRRAPASVLERWNIWVGRQPIHGFSLRMDDCEVSARDVRVWAEKTEENGAALTLCCEKLNALLKENENKAWWMLSSLTDQTLGEVAAMSLIHSFAVTDKPGPEPSVSLEELPETLEAMGLIPCSDPENYLESSYLAYQMEPDRDPESDWRLDVYTGSTRLPVLIQEYLRNENTVMDLYHRDGVAAGFLCYPLDSFDGVDKAREALDFRDGLEAAILERAGDDAVTFLGGASGVHCGYLDFIAWDLRPVLDAAVEYVEQSGLDWASFHSFRRVVPTVRLLDREEPEVDPETGSLLSRADIEQLESFDNGRSGYFYRMLDYLHQFISSGIEAGRFTERQARADLQIALWYAFACNNIDEYEFYDRAARWMPASERKAKGCGMWYYRYSAALMYCGRLEEAARYAEQGAQEEPDYPWIWLQVAKLRCHNGDEQGALEAVARGLDLVPGDHEFLTLFQEIQAGATLEQMEFHWIDPECDLRLQDGLDPDAQAKLRAISCITKDQAGLDRFYEIFQPDPATIQKDAPYCSFRYPIQGRGVSLVFRMNEAGLSKLKPDWLTSLKADLDSGRWLTHTVQEGEGRLETVLVGLDYRISLRYQIRKDSRRFQVDLDEDGLPTGYEMAEQEEGDALEIYTEEEMEAVERHIQTHFGAFEQVFHELVSPDIHVDICMIPPEGERDYYTLVTMGMGAHKMNVPEELAEYRLERAELAIALPKDWKLDHDSMEQEKWYWPVRLLKSLARLPGDGNTWLGWGHTTGHDGPFAEDTALCAAILISPQGAEEGGEVCTLPNGEEVNFYQVIPLCQEELDFKLAHGADELLDRMSQVSFVVQPGRPSALSPCAGDAMDDGAWHLQTIQEKGLQVDELTAFNHMAIYLRWCLEHDLMSLNFLERHWDAVQHFQADPLHTDLRPMIRDELEGVLRYDFFDEQGQAFAHYYYGDGDAPYFPSDVDDYALRYFGPARYHSDEFRDEAYLFIPFDESYYQAMAGLIGQRWECWQRQEAEQEEPGPLARALMDYLDCECRYFPPMKDDDPISAALGYARRLGVREGFVPVLVKVDETLWESLLLNSDPDSADGVDYGFNMDRVRAYRRRLLARPVQDGRAMLAALGGDEAPEMPEYLSGGEENQDIQSYWDYETQMTAPLILAQIPVRESWQVFAWLPFGGWNDCPGTEELMAAAKYWYERYGAVPAALSHDELEFVLPEPVPREAAPGLAVEQYAFCPDLDQNIDSPEALADGLSKSRVWYFWWD